MIKRGLTLVNAQHITASVFINDDESGLHHDYEPFGPLPPSGIFVGDLRQAPLDYSGQALRQAQDGQDRVWLEKLAPHAPIDQYWHNRTGEDACPGGRDRGLP